MSRKTTVLLCIAGCAFLSGALSQYLYPGRSQTPVDYWFVFVFTLLIFAWYFIDTEQRSYPRTKFLNFFVIAVAAFALPYYFFRSRGFRGGFIALGSAILMMFGLGILSLAGGYATYYGLQT